LKLTRQEAFRGLSVTAELLVRKLSSQATFASQTVCVYLEPFKTTDLQLTTALKLSKMQHIQPYRDALKGYRPVPYIFKKLFSRATFSSQTVCVYLDQFKCVREARNCPPKPLLEPAFGYP